jgi:hypothetical protein
MLARRYGTILQGTVQSNQAINKLSYEQQGEETFPWLDALIDGQGFLRGGKVVELFAARQPPFTKALK